MSQTYTFCTPQRINVGGLLLVIIVLTLKWTSGFGQYENHYHYSTFNGLSSSEVYHILQAENGHLWFATDHGLNEFDGGTFNHYSTKDGLTDNTIFRFYKDLNNRIWCVTFNCWIFQLDPLNKRFTPYQYNQEIQQSFGNNVMDNMFVYGDDNFIFTFKNRHGFLKIDGNGNVINNIGTNYNYNELTIYRCWVHDENHAITLTLTKDFEESILSDFQREKLWIDNTKDKDLMFSESIKFPQKNTTYFIVLNSMFKVVDNVLITTKTFDSPTEKIRKIDEDLFWVATMDNGSYLFDSNGENPFHFYPDQQISDIKKDHEGHFWISTLSNGVYHINSSNLKSEEYSDNSSPVNDILWCDSVLWVGYKKGMILKMDKTGQTEIEPKRGYGNAIFSAYENEMFYYTKENLINANSGKEYYIGNVIKFKIFKSEKSDSMVYLYQNGIGHLNLETKEYRSIFEGTRFTDLTSYKNQYYFATHSGLYCLKDTKFQPVNQKDSSLCQRMDVLEVFQNQLFVGTRGNGLIIYNGKDYQELTQRDGLVSNFINDLFVENDSILWICTNAGLNRLSVRKNQFSLDLLTVEDGLKSNETTCVQVVGDSIWVGTREGLSRLSKATLQKEKSKIDYFLEFKSLLVNGEVRNFEALKSLDYSENKLNIEYKAISFDESKRLLYRYKLVGLESKWNYTRNDEIIYSSLEPGKYEFVLEVKGSNEDWKFNHQNIIINISPPFWKTWWFVLIVLAGVSGLIYFFFKFRVLIYNGDILREISRQILKKIRNEKMYLVYSEGQKSLKIETSLIQFVKADGNYIEIHTADKKHTIRGKISEFLDLVPDPIEFIRVRRSYIVRIDKIQEKGKKHLIVNGEKIEVGNTYLKELDKIIL